MAFRRRLQPPQRGRNNRELQGGRYLEALQEKRERRLGDDTARAVLRSARRVAPHGGQTAPPVASARYGATPERAQDLVLSAVARARVALARGPLKVCVAGEFDGDRPRGQRAVHHHEMRTSGLCKVYFFVWLVGIPMQSVLAVCRCNGPRHGVGAGVGVSVRRGFFSRI